MASRNQISPLDGLSGARIRAEAGNHARVFELLESQFLLDPSATLTQIADRVRIERHTIERAVRDRTGASFRQYQRAVRLEAAKDLLLRRPDLSVKEIAARLKYSARAFARFFRRQTGVGPLEYRRESVRAAAAGGLFRQSVT